MENSSLLDTALKPGRAWLSTAYTAASCVGIAVFLWLLRPGSFFPATLGISLCIGLSINSTFILLRERCEHLLHPLLVAILLTALGLGIGLLLGGTLVLGRPLYFFADDYTTIIIGIFFGIVGFTIISSRERLADAREEVANLRAERLAQEREMLETELKLLQAQIEPHFLFNTLSNVVGLVRSDPEAAESTLLNLSTLLRSSLRRTRADAVSLAEELEIVRAYLAIQSIRMQGRLEYSIEVAEDPALLNWPLPPLIIQPLVENAIRHGIDPAAGGGTVSITASRDGAGINIVVADTGVGIREAGSGGEGTGLNNVRSRLRRLYGEGAGLDIRDNKPSGVRVEFRIPGVHP